MIGSRMTTLFLAFSPPFAALIGWLLLGERMPSRGIAAMALVAVGILMAVLGRSGAAAFKAADKAHAARGYLFASLAAIGQAAGMVLTKKGLGGYDVVSGTQIRVIVGLVGFAVVSLLFRNGRRVFVEWPRDRQAVRSTAVGAFFGPALGVALSVFALANTYAGTASTLIGLTPILIIPPAILLRKERPGPLEIVGAVVAVGGAALFFL
jgi:drug/metabolite transporter (DMT)-like permease